VYANPVRTAARVCVWCAPHAPAPLPHTDRHHPAHYYCAGVLRDAARARLDELAPQLDLAMDAALVRKIRVSLGGSAAGCAAACRALIAFVAGDSVAVLVAALDKSLKAYEGELAKPGACGCLPVLCVCTSVRIRVRYRVRQRPDSERRCRCAAHVHAGRPWYLALPPPAGGRQLTFACRAAPRRCWHTGHCARDEHRHCGAGVLAQGHRVRRDSGLKDLSAPRLPPPPEGVQGRGRPRGSTALPNSLCSHSLSLSLSSTQCPDYTRMPTFRSSSLFPPSRRSSQH
jgi:hypothetical protein